MTWPRSVRGSEVAAGARNPELRLTALDDECAPLIDESRDAVDAEEREIGDGGFVDWTGKLTGNRKERLLISGFGVERLV